MVKFRLTKLVESRIQGDLYVRFGGEYLETYRSNAIRRRMLSLHDKQDYESVNGRAEANGTFEYTTGFLRREEKTLELISPYRADSCLLYTSPSPRD